MPKKFQGENTKAAEARARKAAKQEAENERKKQAEEDEFWKDDDKNVARKLQRKEEKAKKQQEVANRKQQNRNLLEQETQQIFANKNQNLQQQKVTRADIQALEDRQAAEKQRQEEKSKLEAKRITVGEDLLTENVNKLVIEGEHARTVDEAIKVLRDEQDSIDRNPEKRLKSAFAAYEEKNLARLKAENPNLRLSQLKQLLKKEWQKSAENPMNVVGV